jgi:hypothetical protein
MAYRKKRSGGRRKKRGASFGKMMRKLGRADIFKRIGIKKQVKGLVGKAFDKIGSRMG